MHDWQSESAGHEQINDPPMYIDTVLPSLQILSSHLPSPVVEQFESLFESVVVVVVVVVPQLPFLVQPLLCGLELQQMLLSVPSLPGGQHQPAAHSP